MLGDSSVEFFRARVSPGTPPVPAGTTFQASVISTNPLDMMAGLQGDVSRMVVGLGEAGDSVAALAENVNRIFTDEAGQQRLNQFLDRSIVAMDDFSRTMRSIDEILADEELRADLKQGLADLPAAVADVRRTMLEAQEALDTFEKVAQDFEGVVASAERNLINMEGFTKPMGESGAKIADAILSGAEGIDRLLEEISIFTRALTSNQGTLGQLVNDPELYNNMSRLVENANVFVWRLNELGPQLRKIVGDASVFTDKIAREPGRIVGGALNRGPGIK
jgi:phospholipid/cholesterol/gamma-HCH transport system substrate-binding protein